MAFSIRQRGNVFLVLAVCLLVLGICVPFSGHDLQRTLQIALALLALLYGLSVNHGPWLDRPAAIGLALVIALGMISSGLAHQPLWAFTEVALFISCGLIAVAFAAVRREGGERLDRVLILIVVLLCRPTGLFRGKSF